MAHNISQASFNSAVLTPVVTREFIRGEEVQRTLNFQFLQFGGETTRYIVMPNATGIPSEIFGFQPTLGTPEIVTRAGAYPPAIEVQRHSGTQTDEMKAGPVGVFFHGGV